MILLAPRLTRFRGWNRRRHEIVSQCPFFLTAHSASRDFGRRGGNSRKLTSKATIASYTAWIKSLIFGARLAGIAIFGLGPGPVLAYPCLSKTGWRVLGALDLIKEHVGSRRVLPCQSQSDNTSFRQLGYAVYNCFSGPELSRFPGFVSLLLTCDFRKGARSLPRPRGGKNERIRFWSKGLAKSGSGTHAFRWHS